MRSPVARLLRNLLIGYALVASPGCTSKLNVPTLRQAPIALEVGQARLADALSQPAKPPRVTTNPVGNAFTAVTSYENAPSAQSLLAALPEPKGSSQRSQELKALAVPLALQLKVDSLLQDAEVLSGSNLIGMDSSTLIGMDAANLIGLDSSTLIGMDGANLTRSDAVPFVRGGFRLQATTTNSDRSSAGARAAYAKLSPEGRSEARRKHANREAQLLEKLKPGLRERMGAYQAVEKAVVTTHPAGGSSFVRTFTVANGRITVSRDSDDQGTVLQITQRFEGTVDGLAIQAERSRVLLTDGRVALTSNTTIHAPDGTSERVEWDKTVESDGTLTGEGRVVQAGGRDTSLATSGNVLASETVTSEGDDGRVQVTHAAGDAKAQLTLENVQQGKTAVDLPAHSLNPVHAAAPAALGMTGTAPPANGVANGLSNQTGNAGGNSQASNGVANGLSNQTGNVVANSQPGNGVANGLNNQTSNVVANPQPGNGVANGQSNQTGNGGG
ncbi:MAG: hypothetical protein VKP62_02085, partial [Candidatus Sericytochromatia bacterium]|nr:hypothetical protein [Candidatus Sericytochromatia bacterium]